MDIKGQKNYRKIAIRVNGKDYLRCLYMKNGRLDQQCKNYRLYFDESGIKYYCQAHINKIQVPINPELSN